jgi:phytol kinase
LIGNNLVALLLTVALAFLWLRFNDFLAHRGFISSPLSRKIIHIGTGPIFVLCWLLFTDVPEARWLAALVPLAITVQFALTGLGVIHDPQSVEAMSRSGDRREILKGPLYYGIVFVVVTLVFWKHSPVGIVALMLLCGGDGLADIIGKSVRSAALPWSRRKTLAGLLSVLLGGWALAVGVVAVFVAAGALPSPLSGYLPGISVTALVGMMVESLPFADVDNLTLPAAAVVVGQIFFG